MTRRRYRYNTETKAIEEVGADWTDAERRALTSTEELTYGKLAPATDGTPLDSRRKHRDYMKANNVTVSSDFTETWKRAEAERVNYFTGKHDKAERREAVGRALHEARKRK